LAAEILLYGIIMRRVKADLARMDEIIKAIKKHKKFLKGLLNNLQNGNDEEVISAIDNLILQVDKISFYKDGFDEEDINKALETIMILENSQKEILPKSPTIFSMAT